MSHIKSVLATAAVSTIVADSAWAVSHTAIVPLPFDDIATVVLAALSLAILTAATFAKPGMLRGGARNRSEVTPAPPPYGRDSLTGLYNGDSFGRELSAALAEASAVAVHRIAADGLDRGTAVECVATEIKIARRIAAVTAGHGIASRLGTGNFAVLQRNACDNGEARGFAERLLAEMSRPEAAGGRASIARIGFALAGPATLSAERLLAHADIALEQTTGAERIVAFESAMSPAEQAQRDLEQRVRTAAEGDGVELQFRPICALADRRLTGFEALPILKSGEGPALGAATFMPIAQNLGLAGQIGSRLLHAACGAALAWPDHLTLSWTAAPAAGMSDDVARALADTGLPANRLQITVTEDSLFDEPTRAIGELDRLKAMGVAVALADFGSGHASLSLLWRFRFDTLCIAATLLARLGADDPSSGREIRSLVALARNLGVTVSAEAVASEAEAAFLRETGCAEAHGPLLGPPLAATEVAGVILADFRAQHAIPISDVENAVSVSAAAG